ncbi:DUF1801 domain-containing protein [Rufibacter soli]
MKEDLQTYHQSQSPAHQELCDLLATAIDAELPEAESKIWHAHPVWFLEGNPVVGYCKLKAGIRLMFWSGADFGEEGLKPSTGKFRDASITYSVPDQVELADLQRWLQKARDIQWDYKNLVKRKGHLERLK